MAMADDRIINWPTLFIVPDWIEAHCIVPESIPGEPIPFELTDEQAWFVLNHYRVREDADVDEARKAPVSAFHYRRSQLVRPQKWGKSPLTAAFICAEAIGPVVFNGWAKDGDYYSCASIGCNCGFVYWYEPGEAMGGRWASPLIQVTATSEDQTDNVYAALRPMIDNGPLSDVIRKTGEEFIRIPGGGQIMTVTSNAKSRLGQRVSFVIQDETGIWSETTGMIKVADTQRRGLAGMGGRSIETTNAWDPSEGSVAQLTDESSAQDIYRDYRMPPPGLSYTNKADRRKIHRHVYGDSYWVSLDAIEAEAFELLERDPAQASRFFGNRCEAGSGAWIAPEKWEPLATQLRVPDKTLITLGFDGSDHKDWSVIRAETLDGHQFTPTYGPDDLPTIWNPREWNGKIPREQVHTAVESLMKRYKVTRMYCDPWGWESEIDEWASKYGDKKVVRWDTRRIPQMHKDLERFLTDVIEKNFTHDGCKISTGHILNARKFAKPGDKYILSKPGEGDRKIDAAMSSVLAHRAAGDSIKAGENIVRKRGYVVSA